MRLLLEAAAAVTVWSAGTLLLCSLNIASGTRWQATRNVCRRTARILLTYPLIVSVVLLLHRPGTAWHLATAVTGVLGLIMTAVSVASCLIAIRALFADLRASDRSEDAEQDPA